MARTLETMERTESGIAQNDECAATDSRSEEELCSEVEDPDQLMPLNQSIVDYSSLDMAQSHLDHQLSKYEKFFVSKEQAELFCMLPLSNEQKAQLIAQIKNAK